MKGMLVKDFMLLKNQKQQKPTVMLLKACSLTADISLHTW